MDNLTDNEIEFLHSVAHHTDVEEEHHDDAPPRFPIISTSIITVVFLALFGTVLYMMSYASRYQVLFQDDNTKNIIESTDSLSSLSMTSMLYDNRVFIYGALIILFILIEGAVLLFHWYHVNKWEQTDEGGQSDERWEDER